MEVDIVICQPQRGEKSDESEDRKGEEDVLESDLDEEFRESRDTIDDECERLDALGSNDHGFTRAYREELDVFLGWVLFAIDSTPEHHGFATVPPICGPE